MQPYVLICAKKYYEKYVTITECKEIVERHQTYTLCIVKAKINIQFVKDKIAIKMLFSEFLTIFAFEK